MDKITEVLVNFVGTIFGFRNDPNQIRGKRNSLIVILIVIIMLQVALFLSLIK